VLFFATATLFPSSTLFAQGPGIQPVFSSYQRVYAIVPMTGAGTYADPVRPMFTPANGFQQNRVSLLDRGPKTRTGLISYTYQISDDGKSALVEFVSVDRAGLREIVESKVPGVQIFEREKASKAAIESAFRGRKREFSLSTMDQKVR